MNDCEKLAQLLFPGVTLTPEDYEAKYPARCLPEGARVTRFAPSPTGVMHIGHMFSALIDKLNADTTGGVFYLRIEDTDKKREVEGGVEKILEGLRAFGLLPSEGVNGESSESGDYGPYKQSLRRDIYACFAKRLVAEGKAYPCFCTEEEISALRAGQEARGENPGYYGESAVCRALTLDEQREKLESGAPYVLRLRSDGDESRRVYVDDLVRGRLEMPENILDIVLLKTDGIPTYHFAHAVDDRLMRTTHVVRGDEWVSSLPVHVQLFKALGFRLPKYIHISPIMKLDDGNKRKLSKRKDPEAAVLYYAEQGYPRESVLEYLMTLANSSFEEWRRANPGAAVADFPFNVKKMSPSGALFDLAKLNDVSKNVISVMSADAVYDKALEWSREYDGELYALLSARPDYARAVLSIDRGCPKPRKDIAKWSDVRDYVSYFYGELYEPELVLPPNVADADAAAILGRYAEVFNIGDTRDEWFARIKELCAPLGFTPNVKEYRQNPDAFKGHVGDVSTVIRMALTSRVNTPDLCAIMSLLGAEEVRRRLVGAVDALRRQ